MRAHSYGIHFVLFLVVDPELNVVFGEDSALRQELVIVGGCPTLWFGRVWFFGSSSSKYGNSTWKSVARAIAPGLRITKSEPIERYLLFDGWTSRGIFSSFAGPLLGWLNVVLVNLILDA
jgi:hypothetical protein